METKFNFNSQVCTSKIQSERLLALGLKKETADMYWWQETDQYGDGNGKWHRQLLDLKEDKEHFKYLDKTFGVCLDVDTDEQFFIPAWSLHRLMCLCFNSGATHVELFEDDDAYEILIYKIEIRIKEGYFNKEYLV